MTRSSIASLATGSIVGSRYSLRDRVASGGMGEVWRAIDDVLARDVAVKVLRPEYAADEDFLARFRAEARNAAMLSHHGIARVYDYGEDDCCPYLVMELVPGEPISALLRREGRLPVDLALGVVAQVGAALGAAHAAGVVHRDVKPANLILTPEGTVKITDFGIARALGAPSLTRTGEVMGTASYLAPEQVSGGRGTAASDVYSLGVVAYECLSGVRPFRDQDPLAIAVAHLKEKPPPLPEEVPEAARDLVLSALAKDPGDRPAGAVEFARQAAAVRRRLRAAHPAGSGARGGLLDVPRTTAGRHASPVPRSAADTRALAIPAPDPGSEPVADPAPAWTWTRETVIVAAIVVFLVAALLSFATTNALAGEDSPAPTSTSAAPAAAAPAPADPVPSSAETSVAPEPTAAAEPTSAPEPAAGAPVIVDAPRYVSRNAPVVEAALTRLGLNVEVEEVEGSGRPGTVTSIAPSGELPAGSDVTLTVVERSRSGSSGNGGGNSGPGGGQGGNDG
jgi:eukaryotic-like serine/threonine-protein kinase